MYVARETEKEERKRTHIILRGRNDEDDDDMILLPRFFAEEEEEDDANPVVLSRFARRNEGFYTIKSQHIFLHSFAREYY